MLWEKRCGFALDDAVDSGIAPAYPYVDDIASYFDSVFWAQTDITSAICVSYTSQIAIDTAERRGHRRRACAPNNICPPCQRGLQWVDRTPYVRLKR